MNIFTYTQKSSNIIVCICCRLWWIIAFSLSVYLCVLSIRSILINWNANPVTMGLTEKLAPISDIPYPMITLCPEIKARKETINALDINKLKLMAGALNDTE